MDGWMVMDGWMDRQRLSQYAHHFFVKREDKYLLGHSSYVALF